MPFKKKSDVLILHDYHLSMLLEPSMFQTTVNTTDSTTNKDSLGMMAVATSVPVRMLWEGNTDALRGGEYSDVVIFRSECFSIL